jgi:ferric-dicitrate binding protein FerR (iron transport regulator)
MTPEDRFVDSQLDGTVSEIRDESIDPAVIEAARSRVWRRLASEFAPASEHIRDCTAFQTLIPAFRAGTLPESRAILVRDHLHTCVACRKVYEGRIATLPSRSQAAPARHAIRWRWAAVAAVFAAGAVVWVVVDQFGGYHGRASVESIHGALFEVTAAGIQPMTNGEDLPDNAEIRAAKASDAVLRLRDGSRVELRERTSLVTYASGDDLTLRLSRGSIIVEAAKRRHGHLYVDTDDCRVAVTGTVFGVSSGVKGSRISVIQGEVHVAHNNIDTVLHPGDQAVSSQTLEPESVREDIGWSRNRDALLRQLDALSAGIRQIRLPALRYTSRLMDRLPADTVLYASIPNLGPYLSEAQSVLDRQLVESPELRDWWAARGERIAPVLEKLRAASEYLGDEIALVSVAGADRQTLTPVLFAEVKRDGFPDFLKTQGLHLAVESRNGFVVFGLQPEAVAALEPVLDQSSGGFAGTPFRARIAQAYGQGAGLLICADLSRLSHPKMEQTPLAGLHYLIVEQKEVEQKMEARATLGFDGANTGIASWLANPAPMGSLDYVTPEASALAAFVVRDPKTLTSQLGSMLKTDAGPADTQTLADLSASMGGEFALAMDGPIMPVPSWKLVAEVYDPARCQAAIAKLAAHAGKTLSLSQEAVDGRVVYSLSYTPENGRSNPLTEAQYTFADGYLIAAPNRALIKSALEARTTHLSIVHAAGFLSLAPRDHFTNFSAVIYENLGPTVAPLANLLATPEQARSLRGWKPALVAAYGAPDEITVAGSSELLGGNLKDLLSGSIAGIAGHALPLGQLFGGMHMGGTRQRERAYR